MDLDFPKRAPGFRESQDSGLKLLGSAGEEQRETHCCSSDYPVGCCCVSPHGDSSDYCCSGNPHEALMIHPPFVAEKLCPPVTILLISSY